MHDVEAFGDSGGLCCCEFIDRNGEKTHLLACCCNCQEFDSCCERLVCCQNVSRTDLKNVMGACLDRCRFPGRGGAFSLMPISCSAILPFAILPAFTALLISYPPRIFPGVFLLVLLQAFCALYMTEKKSRSKFLFYWVIAAVTYIAVIFETSVIPFLEITWDENLILVFLTALSLYNLNMTRVHSTYIATIDDTDGPLVKNGISPDSTCVECRTKVHPRSIHCPVCQICVPRYDQHCYWLDCCIGECNQGYFIIGILIAFWALLYAALLILTTVCRPVFRYGILLPDDCSAVGEHWESALCYCCGVYCVGLSIVAMAQLVWHTYLVSRGVSGAEWGRHKCGSAPYSRGFKRNWLNLFKSATPIRLNLI